MQIESGETRIGVLFYWIFIYAFAILFGGIAEEGADFVSKFAFGYYTQNPFLGSMSVMGMLQQLTFRNSDRNRFLRLPNYVERHIALQSARRCGDAHVTGCRPIGHGGPKQGVGFHRELRWNAIE